MECFSCGFSDYSIIITVFLYIEMNGVLLDMQVLRNLRSMYWLRCNGWIGGIVVYGDTLYKVLYNIGLINF